VSWVKVDKAEKFLAKHGAGATAAPEFIASSERAVVASVANESSDSCTATGCALGRPADSS